MCLDCFCTLLAMLAAHPSLLAGAHCPIQPRSCTLFSNFYVKKNSAVSQIFLYLLTVWQWLQCNPWAADNHFSLTSPLSWKKECKQRMGISRENLKVIKRKKLIIIWLKHIGIHHGTYWHVPWCVFDKYWYIFNIVIYKYDVSIGMKWYLFVNVFK